MSTNPKTAMVLAAGLGTRMRPITDRIPKPLVAVSGRTLLDRGLDNLVEAGVETAVVNVHHHAGQMVDHVKARTDLRITVSDESEALLDSAGGVVKALPLLGDQPFFLLNADTFWIDRGGSNLKRMALAWDAARMDILLMLAPLSATTGHTGQGDFHIAPDGTLARAPGSPDGLVYAGAGILDPKQFTGAPVEKASLNRYFDRAIAAGRLHGFVMDGHWITVGTPDAIPLAERAVAAAEGR